MLILIGMEPAGIYLVQTSCEMFNTPLQPLPSLGNKPNPWTKKKRHLLEAYIKLLSSGLYTDFWPMLPSPMLSEMSIPSQHVKSVTTKAWTSTNAASNPYSPSQLKKRQSQQSGEYNNPAGGSGGHVCFCEWQLEELSRTRPVCSRPVRSHCLRRAPDKPGIRTSPLWLTRLMAVKVLLS